MGVEGAVVDAVAWAQETETVVVSVHVPRRQRGRCGVCGHRAPGYDRGRGRRRWRGLDLGTTKVVIEAEAPRVACREHGVVVGALPWARHGAGHTRAFDDVVAWMAVIANKSAIVELCRVAWPTVGSIITRVSADVDARVDRFAGLRRIGIDEISYKKGHKYITLVVDHDTKRVVWAAPGRDTQTLAKFFEALGEERCAKVELVSADAAAWIAAAVADSCPKAVLCLDPFHVVAWATDALDEVRRQDWNAARARAASPHGDRVTKKAAKEVAGKFKGARYALWKNPEDLTENQLEKLAWIEKTSPRLHRAYLLKEGLRYAFAVKGEAGKEAIGKWLDWARRSQIPEFVKLARTITDRLPAIEATLEHGLSNGLVESTNTKIRALTRMAFGFHSAEALIALTMLSLGGYRPTLPGR